MKTPIGVPLALLTRNNIVESYHSGHLVSINKDGSTGVIVGNKNEIIYPRSSVKAIQAAAMLRAGLDLSPRLLALVASSHSGSQMHQDAAIEILAAHNLGAEALQCSFDKPLGDAERAAWGDKEPTRLAMNCSGKHAGMLATCIINGWELSHYLSPEHPLQKAIVVEMNNLGVKIDSQTFDGCGAPLFAVDIESLARAFHTMTISDDPIYKQVMSACRENPLMVAGDKRLTTRMMQRFPGLFMKDGAEAFMIATFIDGQSVAFKVSDGSLRSFSTILYRVLNEWGITCDQLADGEEYVVLGGPNQVGKIIAAF
jgi:L-asparaginase II